MSLPATTSVRVRLKSDLTHYHPNLIPGSEGYTIGVYGRCSRLSKQYIGVWFPGIRIVDVKWAALETIAEQRHARPGRENSKERGSFKTARQILMLRDNRPQFICCEEPAQLERPRLLVTHYSLDYA